jgi:hypothetical protein
MEQKEILFIFFSHCSKMFFFFLIFLMYLRKYPRSIHFGSVFFCRKVNKHNQNNRPGRGEISKCLI